MRLWRKKNGQPLRPEVQDAQIRDLQRSLGRPEDAGHTDACHHWEWGPCNCGFDAR